MFDITHIQEKLSELQSSGINCGGTWEVRLFDKSESEDNALSVLKKVFLNNPSYNNLDRYKEFAEKGGWNPEENRLIKNLELIELADWKPYFEERIEHWSDFELIARDEMTMKFNQAIFTENKKKFKEALYQCLTNRNLINVYKINENKFDTYDLWKEQIFEDFVFELTDEIVTVSFGWSS